MKKAKAHPPPGTASPFPAAMSSSSAYDPNADIVNLPTQNHRNLNYRFAASVQEEKIRSIMNSQDF